MSHLACAEIADHPLNAEQIRLFRELRMLYHGVPASLANSSGIFLGETAHFDMARPGAALYGINPTPGRANPMRGVVELTGRILQVRKVQQGETVGYGAAWTARRASRIAVVALGYADGTLACRERHRPQAGGAAIIAGKRCPIVGHISMDLICIDVTDLADGAVRRGDIATFIGETYSGRRGRRIGRHHRLRNPYPARPALPSGLSGRLRLLRNGRARTKLRLPELRCGLCALGGPLRSLRRMEHARRGRRRGAGARCAQGPPVRHRAAQGRRPSKPRGLPPASPNSIASPAAAWCAARCCSLAATPASANRRC